MSQYGILWFLLVIFIGLIILRVMPSQSSKKDSLDALVESDMSMSADKYISGTKKKSFWERRREFVEQSRTGIAFETYSLLLGLSVLVAFLVVWWIFHSFIVALLFCWVGYFIPNAWIKNRREKLIYQFENDLVRPLDKMIAMLSGGRTPGLSVKAVAEADDLAPVTKAEFQQIYVEMEYGISVEDAFYNMANRTGSRTVTFIASQLAINREQGGNLAEVLQKVRDSVMENNRLIQDARVQSAEQTGQAKGLAALVFIMIGVMFVAEPTTRQALLGTMGGRFILMGAIVTIAIGQFIIRKMVRIQ